MSDTMKILVATDFSDDADRALAHALRLARNAHARLLIAHVCPRSRLAAPDAMRDQLDLDEAAVALERLREEAESNGIAVEVELRTGPVVSELLDLIEARAPDLVVVGTHGRGALRRMLLGSVSERVCRDARVPVLLVRDPLKAHVPMDDAAL